MSACKISIKPPRQTLSSFALVQAKAGFGPNVATIRNVTRKTNSIPNISKHLFGFEFL